MKHLFRLLSLLVIHAASANAAGQMLAKADNRLPILHPTDKTTVEAREGDASVAIPASMVYVPAGEFTFGEGQSAEKRTLPGYAIGRFEVTNIEYKAFLDATHHRGVPRYWKDGTFPKCKATHPVLFVSLVDAEAYCDWVSKSTGWRIVVPSAPQWEKAARGPLGWRYPWGNDKDSSFRAGKLQTRFNYNAVCAEWFLEHRGDIVTAYVDKAGNRGAEGRIKDLMSAKGQVFGITADGGVNAWIDHSSNTGFVNTAAYRELVADGGFTTPVGRYEEGKSAYGCYDMAGNAYEWTSSVITATNGAERGKEVNDVRGGSWYSTGRSGMSLRTGEGRARSGGYHSVGFRIAMEPKAALKEK